MVITRKRDHRSSIYTLNIPGVKIEESAAQKAQKKCRSGTRKFAQKTRGAAFTPHPEPDSPRTVTETITPLPPQSGGSDTEFEFKKKGSAREQGINPRAMGANPRAQSDRVLRAAYNDPEVRRWQHRLKNFQENKFWLPEWGEPGFVPPEYRAA